MLSACTAGTVGVNADVIRVNLYVNVFLDVRHDIAGHKGGLALSRSVKGRYADQTVHMDEHLSKLTGDRDLKKYVL